MLALSLVCARGDVRTCLPGDARLHCHALQPCLSQESVHITHMEADEAKRCAEVRDSMLAQVDELVAYFNSLYADNELDIRRAQRWARCLV